MNEPLIPMQSANLVMHSILSISGDILHISTKATMKECDDSSDCKKMHDNVACSHANFYLSIAGSSDFMNSTEKHDATTQDDAVTPDRAEDERIYLTPKEITHRTSELPY